MERHELDVLSGVLGLVAVLGGGLVMTNSINRLDVHGPWLAIVGAALVGLVLLAIAARSLRQDASTTSES